MSNINPRIKSFIENNIEYIDEGNWQEFFMKAHDYFFNSNMKRLVAVVDAAGIDTTKDRECLVIKSIGTALEDQAHLYIFGQGATISPEVFVEQLVSEKGYYGFEQEDIVDIIIKNMEAFEYQLTYNPLTNLIVIEN